MTMPANDKILVTDFNTLRNAVANIIGPGSGSTGYGQTTASYYVTGASGAGAVSGSGPAPNPSSTTGARIISTDEYSKLRTDIINVYRHIYGTDPSPASPSVGQLIRYVVAASAVTAEYNISEYNIAEYNATSIAGSSDPYTQFNVFVTDLVNNRFTCATSQSLTESKGSATRSSSWGASASGIGCTISVRFSSADQARYFFNSGGEIRVTASRSGGASTSQNNSWTSLLNAAGTRTFSAQSPSTTLTGTGGQNWYQLTNVFQNWYSASASTPYTANNYALAARTRGALVANNNSGGSDGVDLRAVFTDNYLDPGNYPLDNPNTIDIVDGTLTVLVTIKRATGLLEPSSSLFTIESPTVTFTGNSSGTANVID